MSQHSALRILIVIACATLSSCDDGASTPASASTRAPVLDEITLPALSQELQLSGSALRGAPRSVTVEELEELPLVEEVIHDPWVQQNIPMTGIELRDVVRHFAPEASRISFIAIDDYQVSIEISEIASTKPLLVTQHEGVHLPIAEKGPVRLAFRQGNMSHDEFDALRSRWIWQICEIHFDH